MLFQIILEFRIGLPQGSFLSDLDIFRAVISDHSTPQRVIQIKVQYLFISAEYRFDDPRQLECRIRNGRNAHSVFIHIPVKWIRPAFQTVIRRFITNIVNIEILMRIRIFIKHLIETLNIIPSSSVIRGISVP